MTATEHAPGDAANGISNHHHNDVATSADTPLIPEKPTDLESLCGRIHSRIARFLEEDVAESTLKQVQEQTRIALGVIEEALDRYRYVYKPRIG